MIRLTEVNKNYNMSNRLEEIHRALLLFVAISKTNNEAYSHFIGELKHDDKRTFKNLVTASELFCKTISANFPKESIEAADKLEEYFTEMIFTMIKEGEFTKDDNHLVKNKLNQMLLEPERQSYDTYSINHVLKLIDKSNA